MASMMVQYLKKFTTRTPAAANDPVRPSSRDPLEFSLCYKLRRDALEITAQMPGDGNGLSAETHAKRLIWVQSRLLEAMCSDPALTERQRSVLMAFHSKALRDLIADRRGARRRGNLSPMVA